MTSATLTSNTSGVNKDAEDTVMNNFWGSFHVFSSPLEEICFRRWYLFLGLYSFIKLMNTFLDFLFTVNLYHLNLYVDGYLYSNPLQAFEHYLLIDWQLYLVVDGLFFTVGAFYIWQKSIPRVFKALQQKHFLSNCDQNSPALNKEYKQFLEEYQYVLMHGKSRILTRHIVIGGMMLIAGIGVCFFWIQDYAPELIGLAHYGLLIAITGGIGYILQETITALLLGYLILEVIWIMATTGLYLTKLTSRFKLHIQPGHSDECGGLKFFGDFTLNIALIILMASTFFGFYSIQFTIKGVQFWTIATSVITAVLIILAYFAFFTPLWRVHLGMKEIRSTYEDIYAASMEKVEEKICASLSDDDPLKIRAAKEEAEIVQALHPNKVGYPTWPFQGRMLIAFLTTQFIPIISILIGFIQK